MDINQGVSCDHRFWWGSLTLCNNNITSNKIKSWGFHTWLHDRLQSTAFLEQPCNEQLSVNRIQPSTIKCSSLFWEGLDVPSTLFQGNIMNQHFSKISTPTMLKNITSAPHTKKQQPPSILSQTKNHKHSHMAHHIGHIQSENGVHHFAMISRLNDTFPWNYMNRALMYAFSHLVGVSEVLPNQQWQN